MTTVSILTAAFHFGGVNEDAPCLFDLIVLKVGRPVVAVRTTRLAFCCVVISGGGQEDVGVGRGVFTFGFLLVHDVTFYVAAFVGRRPLPYTVLAELCPFRVIRDAPVAAEFYRGDIVNRLKGVVRFEIFCKICSVVIAVPFIRIPAKVSYGLLIVDLADCVASGKVHAVVFGAGGAYVLGAPQGARRQAEIDGLHGLDSVSRDGVIVEVVIRTSSKTEHEANDCHAGKEIFFH